jgi:membrane protein DedA with SNARE-associated domain
MNDTLVSLLNEYGVLIVFATVLIGQLGLPIPAIAVLMGAGALAADDRAAVAAFALAGLTGCFIADCFWFAVGRRYGLQVLKTLYRIAYVSDASARRIQRSFESFRSSTLIAAKFIPGLSLIAPPLSGALRMGWTPFVLFSSIGSVLWVVAGIGIGIVLGDEIPAILGAVGGLGWGVGAALLVLILGYLAHRTWARHHLENRY